PTAAIPAVRWICASAESIPLPDASVDYIVSRGVLPLAHLDTVIGEIARILRPGGGIVLVLHSWTFYLKWLSVTNLKKTVFGMFHFLVGHQREGGTFLAAVAAACTHATRSIVLVRPHP